MPTGSMTPSREATVGRSTEKALLGSSPVPGISLGMPVVVRLDQDVYRPGTVIAYSENPASITIRIDSLLGDHRTQAVRQDPLGHFLSSINAENLWCIDAPRGSGIGEWEAR